MRRFYAIPVMACALVLGASSAVAGPAAEAGPQPEVTYRVKEMIRGAQIHGANGLAVDVDGRLLVASVFGGEIVVVDRMTGAIEDRLGHESGVDGPDDVAVGPDGSIYWTDNLTGEVGRLTPDGSVSKQFVAPGLNPIAFTGDGRLFVGQAFGAGGDGLYEVDPDLAEDPRVVILDSGSPPYAEALNGFDFGPDGMLYAPQPALGQIVRIDPDSGDMDVVAEGLDADPNSVEFDATGQLFANLGEQIVAVDIEAGSVETRATIPGAVLDNMVFDAKGHLFVSDFHSGAIYRIADGRGVRTLVKGGLMLPGGVALMPRSANSESLFVADVWRLLEYDARSGRLVDVEASALSSRLADDGMIEPWTVAPYGGNVVLTSLSSNAVQIWDPNADEAVKTFRDFIFPANALRFQDDLVVAEVGTGSVVRLDANGARTTLASAPLAWPGGLAATDTELWVADWGTGQIHQIAGAGAPRVVASGLSFPEGMAVDRDGSLLVVESGAGRLTRIDPDPGAGKTVADGLSTDVQGPAALFASTLSSVAVDSTGTILVSAAGSQGSVVYRIRAVPPA